MLCDARCIIQLVFYIDLVIGCLIHTSPKGPTRLLRGSKQVSSGTDAGINL